ncbi:MAG TPA: helix-turn-helix transcriptional regulator [Thermoanaerobaculia bacterium]|nr:helix-turn-helix transcriptional regulator [Thermoanaerobaculia bacterium]
MPLFAVVLRNLRERAGWTQARLEREARLSKGAVCRLEKGDQTLDRFLLARLARVLEIGDGEVERAIIAFEEFPAPARVQGSPADLPGRDWQTIEAVSSRFSRRARRKTQDWTVARLSARRWRSEREAAGESWQRMRKMPSDERRPLVESVNAYQTWAVVERLCEESVRAASNDLEEAHKLAHLAWCAAVHGQGSQAARRWLEGYAMAFEANALQVEGAFRRSEIIFSESAVLLKAEPPVAPLDRARPLILRAALFIFQSKLDAALVCLDEAITLTQASAARTRVHIFRAAVLKRRRQFKEALEALAEAKRCAETSGDARLGWSIAFNEAAYLCEAGDTNGAAVRLEALQATTFELGRGTDVLRLRWLTAQVAAASGRLQEASSILRDIWGSFAERRLWFDAALAVLELAGIELGRGQTREVKNLAAASAAVFAALTLPTELLAAIQVFWDAARREAASTQAAQQLLEEIRRAGVADAETP